MRMKEQILVIDSNESDRDIIKRILSDKYDIIESDNGTCLLYTSPSPRD